jgi:hypothetical protein
MLGLLRVRPKRIEILEPDMFTKNGSSNLYIVHIAQI